VSGNAPKPEETCATCRFYFPAAATRGSCRRYPPFGSWDVTVGDKSVWPAVLAADWCGEWAEASKRG
jgi:hypothetical protein